MFLQMVHHFLVGPSPDVLSIAWTCWFPYVWCFRVQQIMWIIYDYFIPSISFKIQTWMLIWSKDMKQETSNQPPIDPYQYPKHCRYMIWYLYDANSMACDGTSKWFWVKDGLLISQEEKEIAISVERDQNPGFLLLYMGEYACTLLHHDDVKPLQGSLWINDYHGGNGLSANGFVAVALLMVAGESSENGKNILRNTRWVKDDQPWT